MAPPNDANQPAPVAIVGMAGMFAKSSNLKEYWRLIHRAEDGITDVPPTHWSVDDFFHDDPKKPDHVYCKRGGFLPGISFDPAEFGIPPASLEATDTSQLLGLLAARMALQDAGYDERQFDRNRASVIIGVTGTQELVIPLGARLGHPLWRKALDAEGIDPQITEAVISRISDSYVPWQESSFPGLLGNVVAGRICNRLDFGGTNCVVDAACASSMSAINLAILELEAGRSDMVVTGGIDTLNDIFMHMCFAKTQILSPSGDAKPFSKHSDGTVLGEGVGLLVLKRLEDAERDSDRIYAVIKALRSSSDGKSQSIYAPRPEGQEKALRRAYRAAGIKPSTIDLVEAHGTGTLVGDEVEFTALKKVYGQDDCQPGACAIGSVKSNIGHTKAAAGAAGLIKAALAVHHKVLLPTIKADEPDPKLEIENSPFYLSTAARPWLLNNGHPRRSAISAFGFGGSNFHMVIEEHGPKKTRVAWDGSIQIVAFSGPDTDAVKTQLETLGKELETVSDPETFARICFETRCRFEVAAHCRLLFIIDRETDRAALLADILNTLEEKRDKAQWQSGNVFFNSEPKQGKLAFIFPGQGSQYVNMARDLVCSFPEAHTAVETANAIEVDGTKLGQLIFPRPAKSSEETVRQEEDLRRTDAAQPAIGAVSLAMLKILERFQVAPEAAAGHSYGELAALHAAGRLDEETFFTLSADRGRFMAAAGDNAAGESGTMLAVKAPLEEIDALLATLDTDVILANRNSPNQGVLSGSSKGIKQAHKACRKKGFRAIKLPVAAAFHSHLVENARQPFEESLLGATFATGGIPVFANTTAEAYPEDENEARAILAAQLVSPVRWQEEIDNLYQADVRTFLEIGPKSVLTGLVRQVLKGRACTAIALDPSAGKSFGLMDLAKALCRLAAAGHTVDLSRWEPVDGAGRKPLMDVPISGANFRNPTPEKEPGGNRHSKPQESKRNKPVETQRTPGAAITVPEKKPAPAGNAPLSGRVMKTNRKDPQQVTQALKTIEEGMQTLQSMQMKTAETHQRFLETQAQASKALQQMMRAAGRLSGFGERADFELPEYASPVAVQPDTGSAAEVSLTKQAPSETVACKSTPDPVPAAEPAPAQPVADEPITPALLAVVSRLTGYPVETLSLDMDIEADLGIDSIKRVEILSTLEEEMPGLPPVGPEMLGSLKTLGQIVEHLSGAPSAAENTGEPMSSVAPAEPVPSEPDNVLPALLQIVSELTGYPVEMLQPDMDIEADLGIDSIKRVEILSTMEENMPGLPSVGPDMMGDLKTLGQIAAFLSSADAPDRPANAGSTESNAAVQAVLIETVSQLTGYPQEMLDPDMDIEGDLGIDSIKRVEILSTMEEKLPGLPQIGPEMMGSLKSLRQIIDFLTGTHPAGPDAAAAANDAVPTDVLKTDSRCAASQAAPLPTRRIMVPVITEATSGPEIQVAAGKKVWISNDNTELAAALTAQFSEYGIPVEIVDPAKQEGVISGDQDAVECGGLILTTAADKANHGLAATSKWLESCFLLAKAAAPHLISGGEAADAFFATITGLDGAFGFLDGTLANPAAGGLAALTKTAGIEWPRVRCTAFDIDPAWQDQSAIAKAISAELLTPDPARPAEIGLAEKARYTLAARTDEPKPGNLDLAAGDVAVVTGGARGVTAAAAIALARTTGCTTILVGRSAPLPAEPEWLQPLTDEAAIKKAILKNRFKGNATPLDIETEYRIIDSGRSIHRSLAAIEDAGGRAAYFSADVRDKDQIRDLMQRIRADYGPVRAVIHGAGVVEDRLITDKTVEQFRKVYGTKVHGLAALLDATDADDLKYLVLFSSVAARAGNKGQVDYAMANEVLNKLARSRAAEDADCKVVALNWGPWDGGMVSPALKKEFQRQGIDLIPIAGGVERMLQEMAASDTPVETIIGAAFGEADGEKPDAAAEDGVSDDLSLLVKHQVDTVGYPVLSSHILAGRPVVPFALIAEWLGHGALHDNPGLFLHGLDDMRLLNGIKLDEEKKTIRLLAGKAVRGDDSFAVNVQIRNGRHPDGSEFIHSSARAILTDRQISPPRLNGEADIAVAPYHRGLNEVYEKILFHGSDLRGITRITGYSAEGITADVATAPSPMAWIARPLRSRWIADPLVLDSAFQLAIVWCYETRGVVSLPSYAASYRQYRDRFPAEGVRTIFKVSRVTDHKLTGDFTFIDTHDEIVAKLNGYEAVMDATLQNAFR